MDFNWGYNQSINLSDPMLRYPAASKVLPTLDPSADRGGANFIFSTGDRQLPNSHKLFNSDAATIVSSEEMHEDSDEIDALLYSDSDEEASTGHSPLETLETVTGGSEEEVASTGHSEAVPAKRRRIGGWCDPSVADTASSTGAYYEPVCECEDDNEAERKRVKRERIQETVGVLRRIIPGGKGKDAAAVIDEAISYLKSLKLQARAMESGSML